MGTIIVRLKMDEPVNVSCTTDMECSLNGVCSTSGACRCDQPWTGPTCGKLIFQPASRPGASAYGFMPNVTSWGASPLQDLAANGQWHIFVSEIAGRGCGLTKWRSQSRVAHAVASSVMGPYIKQDVALAVEAHNPHVLAFQGEYLLFHIGSADSKNPIVNCTSATSVGDSVLATAISSTTALIHRSHSLSGPWVPAVTTMPGPCENPAPWAMKNGSLAVVCSGADLHNRTWHLVVNDELGLTGKWTSRPIFPGENMKIRPHKFWEDPVLFMDARNHWHILAHCYVPHYDESNDYVSGHLFSKDGLTWNENAVEPYRHSVSFSGGDVQNFSTLERPKLIVDAGRPTHLFNGVSPEWPCSPCRGCTSCKVTPGTDWTYTLVRELGSKVESDNELSPARLKSDDKPTQQARRVGDDWGTNIHWTSPPGGESEIAMLSRAYRVARMDFKWSTIETSKGVYNFAACDALLKTLLSHGVRPYWILDYSNKLYPPIVLPSGSNCTTAKSCQDTCPQQAGQPSRTCNTTGVYYCCGAQGCNGIKVCPGNKNLHACACDGSAPGDPTCDSPTCIAAFGAFAAAAVARFKGHDIVFECLNEPNGMGHDTHATITKLCLAAGKAFSEAGELFVGPALAGLGKDSETYLNFTMQEGILDAFGAVSVHPYRGTPPETAIDDYATLRGMIRKYGKSAQRTMPLISGEWGYTSATSACLYPNRQSEAGQAAYLARMWLVNTLTGAGPSRPLTTSINYDWSDGGTDPASCEGNFGSVRAIVKGQAIVAKPAYTAALTLQTTLGNFETCTGRVTPSSVSPATFPVHHIFVARFENHTIRAPLWVKEEEGGVGFAVWTNGSVTQGKCDGPNRTSTAPVPERIDCGHEGISEMACVAESNPKGPGCCWEPCKKPGACPSVPGGPECYKIEQPVNTDVHVVFDASRGDCFHVIDMLGAVKPKVCASAGGAVSLTLPTHGTTSSPLYLLPINADEREINKQAPKLTVRPGSATHVDLAWSAEASSSGASFAVWRQFDITSRRGEWLAIGATTSTTWQSVGLLGATTYNHSVCVGSSSSGPPTGADCSAVTSSTTLPWSDRPNGSIIQRGDARFPRVSEATMVRRNATLVLFTSRQSQQKDVGDSNITLQRSGDSGRSWSLPVVIPPSNSAPSRANPGAAVLADGTIVLTYFVGESRTSAKRVCRRSSDTGASWSPETDLTHGAAPYMTGAHDRLRLLSNGWLTQTVHFRNHTPELLTFVYISEDNGVSWTPRGLASGVPLSAPKLIQPTNPWAAVEACGEWGFYEAALVETSPLNAPGELLMMARTCTGWLWQSHSRDYGHSWTEPERSNVRHPLAPPNLARINHAGQQEALVLITEPHFTGTGGNLGSRFVLGAQISFDRGRSWGDYVPLEGNGTDFWYSYASVFADAELELLHTVYRANDKRQNLVSVAYQAVPYAQLLGNPPVK